MRKILAVVILLFTSIAAHAATDATFAPERLTYHVLYRWGLINKHAATGVVTMSDTGDHYESSLTVKSEPWADKLYMVRDTLTSRMTRAGLKPLYYEKVANEGPESKHDVVVYSYPSSTTVSARCLRHVIRNGKVKTDQTQSMRSNGHTVDILSSFYYIRRLPLERWNPGYATTVSMFSGKRKEIVTLRYRGIESVEVNGRNTRCHHLSYIFKDEKGKTTSDDLEAWITTDTRRLPVKLVGQLPVGRVECILVSAK